ncbi:serine hydrolase domain-containing protein [Cohnella zeiphila]|uniref:Beta-lactamase family protein n=1 Tax=Cohnella zeiphila TaxID=2761120 RepID=A0A7X0SPX9_9BACL|nr:serine hydrolase domain-containing protein [Cohnella zeiphila]MBB6733993.1 beta-lactamase family protein [Cohnella zeiphila]
MNRYERLTPLLKRFMEQGGPAGCACTVMRRGEVVYNENFGYANVEKKIPIAPDTLYRIYSMTKVITCTAALMLYERGLYLLNDPLGDYLPEFKDPLVYREEGSGALSASPAASPIRIKDLFTMTSGLTYDGDGSETERRTSPIYRNAPALMNVREFSRALAEVPLAFDPGSRWRYGLSHDILGALIEALSGQSFGDFLKKEIFEPLGMKDTAFRIRDDQRDRLCVMYDCAEDGTLTPNTRLDTQFQPECRYESGGGGLISTTGDYVRFAQALVQGGTLDGVRLLSPKTVQLMSTNHLTPPQMNDFSWDHMSGYGYGLGVRVMADPAAGGINGTIGEYGWAGMAGSWLLIDPREQLTVVYMQQMLPSKEPFIANRIRSVVYGAFE